MPRDLLRRRGIPLADSARFIARTRLFLARSTGLMKPGSGCRALSNSVVNRGADFESWASGNSFRIIQSSVRLWFFEQKGNAPMNYLR